ncbi:hypothetical protein SCP_0304100 [Sparassis crispa]|uniref:Uncharacterized protein n=1 Tax=Sparassis crispa TaxID=139825 RepID=A0A401GEX6_9APHY|nr:hypothetical protein SCP_0304100 [Sparassis crispa]GBE80691.1 hypothetical protein SCP_0304100 [Sparassis crispa]
MLSPTGTSPPAIADDPRLPMTQSIDSGRSGRSIPPGVEYTVGYSRSRRHVHGAPSPPSSGTTPTLFPPYFP